MDTFLLFFNLEDWNWTELLQHNQNFLKNYLEDMSSICGATDNPVWTSDNVCFGLHSQGGSP